MKMKSFFASFLSVALAVVTFRGAEARGEVSFDFFYDSLAPYGEWVEVADSGLCWHPTGVDADWAPYSDGYWAFTDAGWTWVSYEEFGGVVYHYGRWLNVEDEGWCWQPDYEWGPAWVSWRSSDDYVGWAPLPPAARWRPERGISVWVDRESDIGPSYYSFCRVRDFGAPVLRPVIVNRVENVTIIRRTVNITNITYNTSYGAAPVIYNGGPDYVFANRRSARPIPALKLVQRTDVNAADFRDERGGNRGRAFNAQAVGNQLIVAAPVVAPPADRAVFQGKATKTFAAEKVTTGWSGIKDRRLRDEVRQELHGQTKGINPDLAPAKPIAAADLKVVPQKADAQATPTTAVREGREKKGAKPASVVAQPPAGPVPATTGAPPVPPADPEKVAREKGRGRMAPPPEAIAPGAPLKPFAPVAGPEQKVKPPAAPEVPPIPPAEVAREKGRKPREKSGTPPVAEVPVNPVPPSVIAQPEKMRPQSDAAAQADQERAAKQRAAFAAQQQQQMDAQQNALRLREKEKAAAAERQKMQGDQDRAARQQAEAAAAAASQQKQMQAQQQQQQQQQNAAQESARAQAAEQQRRALQKQAAEQTRRVPEAPREQMRQPLPPQRAPQVQPPPPTGAPVPSASPTPTGKQKDKDKDKNQ